MKTLGWPCLLADGRTADEFALVADRGRQHRLLIVPALFDEANKLRRLTVDVMRRLDSAGFDCFLPDLPGCNESLLALESLAADDWALAMEAAAVHFGASHVLAVRGGSLIVPPRLPGWSYAPVKGANVLRQLLRARVISSREAGRDESIEVLLQTGQTDGLELAGYRLSPEMLRQLQEVKLPAPLSLAVIEQDSLGSGGGLWLRAEPGEDRFQADALAAIIAMGIAA